LFEDRDDRLDIDQLEEQRKRLIYGDPKPKTEDNEDFPDSDDEPEDKDKKPQENTDPKSEDTDSESLTAGEESSTSDTDSDSDSDDEPEDYELPQVSPKEAEDTSSDTFDTGPLDHLSDEEIDELEIAKFAEKHLGDKHKGLSKKVYDFYEAREKYIAEAREKAEDEGYEWSEDDEDYQKWLQKNEPKLKPRDRREIVKKMLKEEVLKEVQPELETMRLQQWQQEQKKRYQSILDNFQKEMMDNLPDTFPDDDVKLKEAIQQSPEEWAIITEEVNRAGDMTTLYLNLNLDSSQFNENDTNHKTIENWINREGEKFYKEGGKHRIRDGKKFVPIATFNQLGEKERENFWTFSEEEVVKMIRVAASRRISKRITEFNETIERAAARKGFIKSDPKKEEKIVTKPKEEDDTSLRITPGVRVPKEDTKGGIGEDSWIARMGYISK